MMNNTYKFKLNDDGRGYRDQSVPVLTVYHTADGHQYLMITAGNLAPASSDFAVDGEPVRHEDMMRKLGGKAVEITLRLRADLVEVTQSTK